jgi:hypothetical protein
MPEDRFIVFDYIHWLFLLPGLDKYESTFSSVSETVFFLPAMIQLVTSNFEKYNRLPRLQTGISARETRL